MHLVKLAIDDKYIVSYSIENTITIWNRLQKKTRNCFENASNLVKELRLQMRCFFFKKLSNHNIKCFIKENKTVLNFDDFITFLYQTPGANYKALNLRWCGIWKKINNQNHFKWYKRRKLECLLFYNRFFNLVLYKISFVSELFIHKEQ